MKLFRYSSPSGPRLGLRDESGYFDLSGAGSEFESLARWLAAPYPIQAVHDVLDICRQSPLDEIVSLLPPIDVQEVWASGVTYLRSKAARMDESRTSADIYDQVYDAERPELFFKSTAARVVGHGMPIRIRRDSTWNVPEPEWVLVLSAHGELVGTTIGNDMSSRSIEGDNPLYLPQAKIYDGGCAIGPMIDLQVNDTGRRIHLTIERDGAAVFRGEISTTQMRRNPAELARWLFRELQFPDGVFLFTGTGIVPPNDFTLNAGDVVRISIDGIGELKNTVAEN